MNKDNIICSSNTNLIAPYLSEQGEEIELNQNDYDSFYDDFREAFYEAIDSNYNSKNYYVEGSNMTWLNKKGHRIVNENENLLDIFSINGDFHLDVIKGDDNSPIHVIRYSHDEPTGAFFKIYNLEKAVQLKLVEND